MSTIIYDWKASRDISQWRLEGRGELQLESDGSLKIRTYHCGPDRRATNAWLKDVELPEHFEMEWDYWSQSQDGNTMVIFNALPYTLNNIFEDERADAKYEDLNAQGKIVCYTIGFHRAPYGRPSVLRKLGGETPESWRNVKYGTKECDAMSSVTTQHTADEPLTREEKGKLHHFKLTQKEGHIRFWVNNSLIHDYVDNGGYPCYSQPLKGGRVCFRNFGGFADDFYPSIVIKTV